MRMLLDTNILVDVLRKHRQGIEFFQGLSVKPAISIISVVELYAGARSQRDEQDIAKLVGSTVVLQPVDPIGQRAGSLLRHFGKSHNIDIPDAVIAATADHFELPLATLNVKHFPMFERLRPAYDV